MYIHIKLAMPFGAPSNKGDAIRDCFRLLKPLRARL